MQSLCIVVVCQSGELELKAALAVASIRAHHATSTGFEIVAAVPRAAVWGTLRRETQAVLVGCGARVVEIDSPFGRDYPIGNKLAAVGVPTEAATTLFLDSDILCCRPIEFSTLQTAGVLAKPADLNTLKASREQWQAIYGLFGLTAPEESVVTTVSEEIIPPYFNAGVVSVGNGAEFSNVWIETARIIDRSPLAIQKRPWLDQIALPVACARLKRPLACLSEAWNYPVHLRCLPQSSLPVFSHYHWPAVIAAEPALVRQVGMLVDRHPEIGVLMHEFEGWAVLAEYLKPQPH